MVLTNHRLTAVSGSTLVSPVYILPAFILTKGFVLIIGYSLYALLFPCAPTGFVHLAFPIFALMKTRPNVVPLSVCLFCSINNESVSHVSPVLEFGALSF